MSYPHQNHDYSFNYDMYNHTFGIHQVVRPYQLGRDQSSGGNVASSASDPIQSSGISHSVEIFVPMNIPQYNRDGSLTVLFQMNTERNSLSIPLEKCLDDSGHHLTNPDEIMFSTVDRTQVYAFKLVIAFQWPGYDTVEYPIDIGTNEAPVTRAQLARQIAYHFFGFFKLCDSGHFTQKSDFQWKVGGQGGYSFYQMHLSAFWNIEGTSWGASIRVLRHA
ncbi:hypothetical protein K503DRAFT_784475 [Rhizopogon vinicolor AM-OR11-026]|uniref:Uncharacterized protein n=1 Tax=Rhizopogon vinicolor AM-OR11-026 TaxID=1314800 RepID=A0A1B7MUH7_9AGAM|nr:hypothetical protein K503DRAFT_784475 [Rhizopogon vinicolor AM-OR11-026]